MKQILYRLVPVFLISIFTGSVAFADTIKQKITFAKPIVVNGTVVQKGTYDATFDDQTNELSITKGKKVIAKAPARLEELSGKQAGFFIYREEGTQSVLLTVAFKKNQATIVNNASNASAAP